MKLAYPVEAPDNEAQLMSFMGSYEKNMKIVAEIGYGGIELMARDLDQIDTEFLISQAEKNQMKIAAISTAPLDKQDQLHLLDDIEKSRECANRIRAMILFAARTGACVLLGKVRGEMQEGAARGSGRSRRDLADRIRDLAGFAQEYGVRLAIEPQYKSNINNINTIAEGLEFLELVGEKNVLLHLDFYHMALSETDILSEIRKVGERIGFVHVSDSERKVPGKGVLPVAEWIKIIRKYQPDIWFSPEIKQQPDSVTVCRESMEFFENIDL